VRNATLEPTADTLDAHVMRPGDIGVAAPAARRSRWRAVRGVVSTLAGIVSGGVAVFAVVVAVSTHLSADGQLGVLGHPVMTVLSGSMAPVIDTGDLVVENKLTPAQASNLQPGQIISFRAAGGTHEIFTHRIIGIELLPDGGVSYVTKGDANGSRDTAATVPSDVVGLYQARIPYGGYILDALHRPLVLGLLLAAPSLWLLAGPLWGWVRLPDEPASDTETEGGETPA